MISRTVVTGTERTELIMWTIPPTQTTSWFQYQRSYTSVVFWGLTGVVVVLMLPFPVINSGVPSLPSTSSTTCPPVTLA